MDHRVGGGGWGLESAGRGKWGLDKWRAGKRHAGKWHAGERHAGERHAGKRHVSERHAGERHAGEWNKGEWHASEQAGDEESGAQQFRCEHLWFCSNGSNGSARPLSLSQMQVLCAPAGPIPASQSCLAHPPRGQSHPITTPTASTPWRGGKARVRCSPILKASHHPI